MVVGTAFTTEGSKYNPAGGCNFNGKYSSVKDVDSPTLYQLYNYLAILKHFNQPLAC